MEPSEQLDLTSDPNGSAGRRGDSKAKPFLGVVFSCCNIYVRAYRDRKGGAFYEGRCPQCFAKIRFVEGNGGRRDTFFRTQG
ncbi:hypothetical protein [Rosistilla oblonga]|uniref:hypothetical protein n=1 Tax=Rosistilla oblonga TaxID=2527990 RepID=UPI003A97F1AA